MAECWETLSEVGGLPKLEELDFSWSRSLGDGGVGAVMPGLEEGDALTSRSSNSSRPLGWAPRKV